MWRSEPAYAHPARGAPERQHYSDTGPYAERSARGLNKLMQLIGQQLRKRGKKVGGG